MAKITIEELLIACESFAATMAEPIGEATKRFPYPEHFSQLIWRCVLRKSYDYFCTIVELTSSNRSWAALPLLRPMCEDLFYLGYLTTLDVVNADSLVKLWARREVLEGLTIQSKADNPQAWETPEETGPDHYETVKKGIEDRLKSLKGTLAEKGWNRGKEKPTALEAAESVAGGRRLYRILYFGTSKHVHFSPHQLMRMVGCEDGKTGSVRRNPVVERLDAAFGLSNAAWLFILTLVTCQDHGFVCPECPSVAVEKLMAMLREFGRVPFIIPQEVHEGPIDADPKPQKPVLRT